MWQELNVDLARVMNCIRELRQHGLRTMKLKRVQVPFRFSFFCESEIPTSVDINKECTRLTKNEVSVMSMNKMRGAFKTVLQEIKGARV